MFVKFVSDSNMIHKCPHPTSPIIRKTINFYFLENDKTFYMLHTSGYHGTIYTGS